MLAFRVGDPGSKSEQDENPGLGTSFESRLLLVFWRRETYQTISSGFARTSSSTSILIPIEPSRDLLARILHPTSGARDHLSEDIRSCSLLLLYSATEARFQELEENEHQSPSSEKILAAFSGVKSNGDVKRNRAFFGRYAFLTPRPSHDRRSPATSEARMLDS